MKNHKTLNLGAILCLSGMFYLIYFLLITEKLLPFSVSSALHCGDSKEIHLLAVALVPIGLGLTIFGAAVISLYFGTAIQRWISRFWG